MAYTAHRFAVPLGGTGAEDAEPYQPRLITPPGAQPLSMYDFLIKPIRDADQAEGGEFLRRLLIGAQTVWDIQTAQIQAIPKLWSVKDCPDEWLHALKAIVGWSSEPDDEIITSRLPPRTLRRLIAASGELWRTRGSEGAILNALRQVTTARARMLNWFDFRWVCDETALGEANEGSDPWCVHLPGTEERPEQWSHLRIVDDGTLDRNLVGKLVNLMRPSGERCEIVYLSFLDEFLVDGDATQWDVEGTLDAGRGRALLSPLGRARVSLPQSEGWGDVLITAIFLAERDGFTLAFSADRESGDRYELVVDSEGAALKAHAGGATNTLATVHHRDFAITDVIGSVTGVRVQASSEGAKRRIKVYLDNVEIVNLLDDRPNARHTGGVEIGNPSGTSSLEIRLVEVAPLPITSDTVGPSTRG